MHSNVECGSLARCRHRHRTILGGSLTSKNRTNQCIPLFTYLWVMDAGGKKSLALFPAKFQKSMWIKRGSFVIIDERGRDMALESGSKVACMVSQVLFHEQVRVLQKSPEWPDIFKTTTSDNAHPQTLIAKSAEELNSSDDDELPPLEANLNRIRPDFPSDSESDSDTDSEQPEGSKSLVDNTTSV